MFYLFAIVFGFAYGGKTPLISLISAELFGLGSHGIILGMVSFITTAGCATGPLVAGHIFDVTGSYQAAFLICAIISIIATTLAISLKLITGKGGEE